jgi:hypothetical protein
VHGVDAEAPVIRGRPSQFVTMLRGNGVERAAKSPVRHVLFDRTEERALERALRQRGFALDPTRLIVADARVVEVEPESLDLVISEDVFEHLQRDTVEQVVAAMARWLRPTGIALIRFNVFTGITGVSRNPTLDASTSTAAPGRSWRAGPTRSCSPTKRCSCCHHALPDERPSTSRSDRDPCVGRTPRSGRTAGGAGSHARPRVRKGGLVDRVRTPALRFADVCIRKVGAMTRHPQRSIREPDRASQRTDLSFGPPPALLWRADLPINCETAN